MFDISVGVIKNIYKCKIDNHILEIELLNSGDNDVVKVWYSYNNNMSTTELYLDLKGKKYYGANITNRQLELIAKKVEKALEIHNKFIIN